MNRLDPHDIKHLAEAIGEEVCRAGFGGTPSRKFTQDPCRRWQRGAQYFAQLSPFGGGEVGNFFRIAASPAFNSGRQMVSTGQHDPSWWVISGWGRSVLQRGAGILVPSSDSDLSEAPLVSRARMRIRWNDASGGTFRDITIGNGAEAHVYACGVNVEVLAPSATAVWGPNSSTGSPVPSVLNGVAVTESVGVSVLKADGALGRSEGCVLVDSRVTAGGAGANFPVAPGSRFVTLSQPAGVIVTANFIVENALAFSEPVVLDPVQRFVRIAVPAGSDSIQVIGADDILVTAVWELDV